MNQEYDHTRTPGDDLMVRLLQVTVALVYVIIPTVICLLHSTWQQVSRAEYTKEGALYFASMLLGGVGVALTLVGFILNHKRSRRKFDVNQKTLMGAGLILSAFLLIYSNFN